MRELRELGGGEGSISALCATSPMQRAQKGGFISTSPVGVADFLQALGASSLVAVQWEAVWRELLVLLAQGWEAEASPCLELEPAEDTARAAPSQCQGTSTSSTSAEVLGWRLCRAPA